MTPPPTRKPDALTLSRLRERATKALRGHERRHSLTGHLLTMVVEPMQLMPAEVLAILDVLQLVKEQPIVIDGEVYVECPECGKLVNSPWTGPCQLCLTRTP